MKDHAAILSLLLACAAPAAAQDARGAHRILLDRMLQERHVIVTALDGGHISYSEGGLVRTEPLSEYLGMLPAPPRPAPRAARGGIAAQAGRPPERDSSEGVVLELVDGQRFTGSFRADSPGQDVFSWVNAELGPVELRIDDVSALRVGARGAAIDLPRSDSSDIVVLLNGDRLEGIIERFGEPLVISVGEAEHRLPLERIAAVSLANPPMEPTGTYLWLADGTVVAARAMHTTRMGELQISPRISPESESSRSRVASVPLDRITAVNFDVRQLIALASLPPIDQHATGQRRWSRTARTLDGGHAPLDAADVLLPGPMEISWSLPEGAARLAATAELPRESWTWGDCELVVELRASGGQSTEIARHRLNADKPVGLINTELPAQAGTTLVVRVEPGEYGPVQDRVILRRPLLSATPAPR